MNTTVDQPSPAVAVVALDGELDATNFGDLIETGRQLYAGGARLLVVDLSRLSYMSSRPWRAVPRADPGPDGPGDRATPTGHASFERRGRP
jgi:hypothetical protein